MKQLNVLAVGDPAVYGYVDKSLNIISSYEVKNNIKVVFDIVDWVDYYDALMNSFTNYKYDIVMVAGHLWLPDFVNKGYLKEFNVSDDSLYDFNDVLEVIQNEMKINNKQYLLPSFCDGHMLAYRTDKVVFESQDNISINDIKDYLDRNRIRKVVLKAHPSEIFLDFLPYLRSQGTDFIDELGRPLFNNEQGIEALKSYKGMLEHSSIETLKFGNEEVLSAIQKDQISLAVSWGGQIGQILNQHCINRETLKFVGLKESWNVTWSFGIPSLTTKTDEALQFMKYLSSKKVDKLIGGYCGNPTRTSTFIEDGIKHAWYKNLYNMLVNCKPLPNLLNTGELIGVFTEELVKYMSHRK